MATLHCTSLELPFLFQVHLLTISDLPPVKPSAIALGTAYTHAVSLAVLGPIFGQTYRDFQAANSREDYLKSKEAATAAAAWGSSLVGSGLQAYGVGALLNATGTLSYKGAAYLGSLIFLASSAPSVSATPSVRFNVVELGANFMNLACRPHHYREASS